MRPTVRFTKTPVEVLDYHVDFSLHFDEDMEATDVVVTPDPGNSIEVIGHSCKGNVVTFWVTGGQLGSVNQFGVHILASGGGRLLDLTQRVEITVVEER